MLVLRRPHRSSWFARFLTGPSACVAIDSSTPTFAKTTRRPPASSSLSELVEAANNVYTRKGQAGTLVLKGQAKKDLARKETMSLALLEEMKPSLPSPKQEDEERGVMREEVVYDDAKELEDWNESRGRSRAAEKGKAAAVDLDEHEVRSDGSLSRPSALTASLYRSNRKLSSERLQRSPPTESSTTSPSSRPSQPPLANPPPLLFLSPAHRPPPISSNGPSLLPELRLRPAALQLRLVLHDTPRVFLFRSNA